MPIHAAHRTEQRAILIGRAALFDARRLSTDLRRMSDDRYGRTRYAVSARVNGNLESKVWDRKTVKPNRTSSGHEHGVYYALDLAYAKARRSIADG
jgi:hypothetical protein